VPREGLKIDGWSFSKVPPRTRQQPVKTPVLPPTVSSIVSSAADADPTTPGIQVLAGSTVRYSASATDPNGYPLAWQWLYSIDGGQETLAQGGTGGLPAVSYLYSDVLAGKSIVWKLRVSNGHLTSESDLTVGIIPPPVVTSSLTFPAGGGTISGPFTLADAVLSQSVETGLTNGGQAVYNFTIKNPGNYAIQVLVNAPRESRNSFFVNIDAPPEEPAMIFDIPQTSGFENHLVSWRGAGTASEDQFNPKTFYLAAGPHRLMIVGRDAGGQLKSFSIVPLLSPAPPTNLHIVGSQ
jgi:hypothetical protein